MFSVSLNIKRCFNPVLGKHWVKNCVQVDLRRVLSLHQYYPATFYNYLHINSGYNVCAWGQLQSSHHLLLLKVRFLAGE